MTRTNPIQDESGRTLVIALAALAIGVLLVSAFLAYVAASQRAAQAARQEIADHYAADAGIEYGLWQLQYGGLTNTLTITDPVETLTLTLNGRIVTITVTRVMTP